VGSKYTRIPGAHRDPPAITVLRRAAPIAASSWLLRVEIVLWWSARRDYCLPHLTADRRDQQSTNHCLNRGLALPAHVQWVLECTVPAKGSARIGANVLVLEITEPQIVSLVRSRRPGVLVRQAFYPGGRFFSDHVSIRYR
jgi:hypothetical protein